MAFGPDGTTLATGDENADGKGSGTTYLWRITRHYS